jgi:hypothetical protein
LTAVFLVEVYSACRENEKGVINDNSTIIHRIDRVDINLPIMVIDKTIATTTTTNHLRIDEYQSVIDRNGITDLLKTHP